MTSPCCCHRRGKNSKDQDGKEEGESTIHSTYLISASSLSKTWKYSEGWPRQYPAALMRLPVQPLGPILPPQRSLPLGIPPVLVKPGRTQFNVSNKMTCIRNPWNLSNLLNITFCFSFILWWMGLLAWSDKIEPRTRPTVGLCHCHCQFDLGGLKC